MYRLTNWLNKLVKQLLLPLLLFTSAHLRAQDSKYFSLKQVYQLAQQNYPAIKQKDLIKQTEALTLKNISTGLLPQVAFNGQARGPEGICADS